MAVRAKIEPLSRDIALILQRDLSPAAQSAAFAGFARSQLQEAQEINRRALGRVPPHDTFVDGRRTEALESVRPDGVIVFEFELMTDVVEWVQEKLLQHSPIRSGRFRKSHRLFADGAEIQFGAEVPAASEYVFVNTQPYSRKLERGLSKQAPDGIFHAVAVLAHQRYSNVARVAFTYRQPEFGAVYAWARKRRRSPAKSDRATRQPAIVITAR